MKCGKTRNSTDQYTCIFVILFIMQKMKISFLLIL